jgi:hypothetical protein
MGSSLFQTQKGPMIESAAVAEPITDPFEVVCLELSAPNPEFHGTHLTLLESSSAIQLCGVLHSLNISQGRRKSNSYFLEAALGAEFGLSAISHVMSNNSTTTWVARNAFRQSLWHQPCFSIRPSDVRIAQAARFSVLPIVRSVQRGARHVQTGCPVALSVTKCMSARCHSASVSNSDFLAIIILEVRANKVGASFPTP